MQDIKQREAKMQEARKNTPWRDFIKEIGSRCSLVFYKNHWFISRYPNSDRIGKVISQKDFEDTRDILCNKWIIYNTKLSFFDNYRQLSKNTNLWNMLHYTVNENSNFSDVVTWVKNAYLSSLLINWCENIGYSYSVKDNSRNVLNSVMVWDKSENIYTSSGIIHSYMIFFSKYITDSSDIWFSSNLIGCTHCIWCNGLENKSFCINWKEYTKEEYSQKKEQILKNKQNYPIYHKKLKIPWKNIWSKEVSWNFNIQSNNIKNWLYSYQVSNWKNLVLVWGEKWNENMFDVFTGWSPSSNDFYWVMGAWVFSNKLFCSQNILNSSNILGLP